MKWSTSGLYSAHSRMAEGRLPGVLHIICCPLGNGLLPHMLRPALPPQATWRLGDGCPWTKGEKRKIYGWRHMPAAYNAWRKHPSDTPGKPKAREWSHGSALWCRHSCPDCNGKECKSVLCERMLAVKEWYCTKAAHEHSSGPHNPLSR